MSYTPSYPHYPQLLTCFGVEIRHVKHKRLFCAKSEKIRKTGKFQIKPIDKLYDLKQEFRIQLFSKILEYLLKNIEKIY